VPQGTLGDICCFYEMTKFQLRRDKVQCNIPPSIGLELPHLVAENGRYPHEFFMPLQKPGHGEIYWRGNEYEVLYTASLCPSYLSNTKSDKSHAVVMFRKQ
jgi:hypothetical protein